MAILIDFPFFRETRTFSDRLVNVAPPHSPFPLSQTVSITQWGGEVMVNILIATP
jgi:hypothetical protein